MAAAAIRTAGDSHLDQVAAVAVEALRRRQSVDALPEDAEGWNDAYIAAIRACKEKFRGSPDLAPLLDIASHKLYGRDIHWALEIIQNAEDEGARRVIFVFDATQVLIVNDGEAFTASDVWGICSAGHSAKPNKIGFFGIGFKSVYKRYCWRSRG